MIMVTIIVTNKKYAENIWNGLSRLLILNFLFFLVTIPVQAWAMTQINLITANNDLGIFFGIGAALNAALQLLPPAVHFLLFALDALAFGPMCVAMHAVVSRTVQGERVWLWPDLKKSISENWKQAMLIGVVDILVFFASLNYFVSGSGGMRLIWLVMVVIYLCFRAAVYEILFRVELRFFDLMKDALLIGLLSFWRVLLLILGGLALILACGYIDVAAYPVFLYVLIDVLAALLIHPQVRRYLLSGENEEKA